MTTTGGSRLLCRIGVQHNDVAALTDDHAIADHHGALRLVALAHSLIPQLPRTGEVSSVGSFALSLPLAVATGTTGTPSATKIRASSGRPGRRAMSSSSLTVAEAAKLHHLINSRPFSPTRENIVDLVAKTRHVEPIAVDKPSTISVPAEAVTRATQTVIDFDDMDRDEREKFDHLEEAAATYQMQLEKSAAAVRAADAERGADPRLRP
jgi:hypothetical protein